MPSEPLRVLYIWDADYPWDVRTEKICAALRGAGVDVHIAARNRAWRPDTEQLPEGVVHRMPPWRWAGRRLDGALGFPAFFSPRWRRLIAKTIRAVRPDVLVVRDLPLCPTAIWAGRDFGLPVLFDMAENYPSAIRDRWEEGLYGPADFFLRNPAAVAAVERYCLPRVDGVITVIEESADRVAAAGVPRERIVVVSNTPPRARALEPAPARPPSRGGPLELVYLGLIEIPRGLKTLVDGVARLRDTATPVRLSLVGTGVDHARLVAHARALGLTDAHVVFHGFVRSHERAREIVAAADVGAVPHPRSETWNTTIPNKLFDYMAAGLPVVSADAAPLMRIVTETGAGEVFRSGDADDLAAALVRLTDPRRRRACGEAGRLAVSAKYNWERDAAVLLEAIERAAGAAGARRDAALV
jgi:glycosyltransferase involved in cell wall biosynthesis